MHVEHRFGDVGKESGRISPYLPGEFMYHKDSLGTIEGVVGSQLVVSRELWPIGKAGDVDRVFRGMLEAVGITGLCLCHTTGWVDENRVSFYYVDKFARKDEDCRGFTVLCSGVVSSGEKVIGYRLFSGGDFELVDSALSTYESGRGLAFLLGIDSSLQGHQPGFDIEEYVLSTRNTAYSKFGFSEVARMTRDRKEVALNVYSIGGCFDGAVFLDLVYSGFP